MSLYRKNKINIKNINLEKGWSQRFVLNKIPPFDAFKDVRFLSYGLTKSKTKYDLSEKERLKIKKNKLLNLNDRYPGRFALSYNIKKSNTKENIKFSITELKSDNQNNNKKRSFSSKYKYSGIEKNFYNNKTEINDDDLTKELETVKELWENFGVDINFQKMFIEKLNYLKSKNEMLQFLKLEKKQMQKFKIKLTLVVKKMIDRKNEILRLKKLLKKLEQINMNSNLDENLQNINENNKNKVEAKIDENLSSIQLITVDLVNLINNFLVSNAFYLLSGKINIHKIYNDYNFNELYVLSMKNEMDFLKNSYLENLYDLENFEYGDPFLLSISEKQQDSDNNNEKLKKLKKLKINDSLLLEIQNCLFFMNQIELISQIKFNNYFYFNQNGYSKNIKKFQKTKHEDLNTNNKFNLEKNIYKLKTDRVYNNIFYDTTNNFKNINYSENNSFKRDAIKNKNQNQNQFKKSPTMTSEELNEKFLGYYKMKKLIFDVEYNNDQDKGKSEKENKDKKTEKERRKKKEDEIIKIKENLQLTQKVKSKEKDVIKNPLNTDEEKKEGGKQIKQIEKANKSKIKEYESEEEEIEVF